MTRKELQVFVDKSKDPAMNIAREEEFFQGVERGSRELLRFWVNSECLVRGRTKNAKYGWYNEELAQRMGVPVFERSTGGGVVYNDEGNLNWSLFLKRSGAFQSPTRMFGEASGHLIEALGRLGVRAQFSPPNRIDVSNRKVSGMAARSTSRALLVHGTLLLNSDLRKLNMLCIPPAGCPPVSNLNEWVEGIAGRDVVDAFVAGLRDSGYRIRMGA